MIQGSHSKELLKRKKNVFTQKLVCKWAALLISLKKLKELRCPSPSEWVNELWYIHTTECYYSIQHGTEPHQHQWNSGILLCEWIHTRLPTRRFRFYDILGEGKLQWQKTDPWLPGAGGCGRGWLQKKLYSTPYKGILWHWICSTTWLCCWWQLNVFVKTQNCLIRRMSFNCTQSIPP